ncbi:MAG: DNA translocase FtsK 4TM domain-containing protein, partial [Thermoanaerobaculia bacterium]
MGLVLGLAALLLLVALASYDPADSSFLQQTTVETGVRNLIGPVGSQIAAAFFGSIGLAALLVPVLLALAAWRRLRPRRQAPVAGRTVGALVLLLFLPALLQLTLADISWRGEPVAAGGGLGRLLASAVESQIGVTGTFFLVLGGVLIGTALLVQSTLGELVAGWLRRFGVVADSLRLGRARRRERREKEKTRK